MLTFFCFLFSCSLNNSNDSGNSLKSAIINPISAQKEFILSPSDEIRFLIEGDFVPSTQTNQIDIIFGSYSSSSTIEIYLFENNNEEAIWGKELSAENSGVFTSTLDCVEGCSLQFVGKALHTQGTEDIKLKLEVRSSLEEGEFLISNLF